MLTEQIIEVESRVLGLQVVQIPKTGNFHDKTKIFKGKSLSEWFNAKNVAENNVPWFLWPGQVTKFNPKMKDILNVFWTWLEVKGGICSIGSQISKILYFQMALKTCEMWSKWHSNSHFFPKTYKKSPSGRMLRPQTPIASGSWWLRPQASFVTCLSCTNLLTTSPNFDTLINLFDLRL